MRTATTRVSVIFAALVSLLGIAAAPANATFPGANGKIVFERVGPNGDAGRLYVVNPDGTGDTQLPALGHTPVWSGSGTRLAYECVGAICVADASGNQLAQYYVITGAFERNPAWSPNDAQIAFNSYTTVHFSPPPDVWKMNADGTGVTDIRTDGAIPDWSPDGSKIAFVSNGIWVMNADGSNATQLTCCIANYPSWSPDGAKIAFDNGAGDIFTVNVDGSGLTQLTSDADSQTAPVWSPDGTKIAFTGSNPAAALYGVFVMNSDGSSPVLVADQGSSPDWQAIPRPHHGHHHGPPKHGHHGHGPKACKGRGHVHWGSHGRCAGPKRR